MTWHSARIFPLPPLAGGDGLPTTCVPAADRDDTRLVVAERELAQLRDELTRRTGVLAERTAEVTALQEQLAACRSAYEDIRPSMFRIAAQLLAYAANAHGTTELLDGVSLASDVLKALVRVGGSSR